MSEILVEITRGPIAESVQRGHVAVCNAKGELIAWAGDPDTVTYMRSAAKPIQALNIFLSGAQERYQFEQKELSIACASHYGEEFHQKTILGMLEKLGLDLSDLLCGHTYSISEEVKNRQLREHFKLDNYNSDCSGKHCGFLAACLVKGYSIKGYNSPDHPLQKDILQVMSEVCEVPAEEIPIGVDGCSVPVHALPVKNMAIGFAREANPEYLPEKYREGAGKLYDAMNAHPEMVAGTHGFCTELMEKTHGKLFGKLGAEGVYCIGIRDKNLGIAVKMEDGIFRGMYPTVISVLDQLGLLTGEEKESLKEWARPRVRNVPGTVVGEIRPVFTLHYAKNNERGE